MMETGNAGTAVASLVTVNMAAFFEKGNLQDVNRYRESCCPSSRMALYKKDNRPMSAEGLFESPIAYAVSEADSMKLPMLGKIISPFHQSAIPVFH